MSPQPAARGPQPCTEGPDAGRAGTQPTWVVTERGSFAVGECLVCGWASPARRARASAQADVLSHADVCPGAPGDDAATGTVDGAPEAGGADASAPRTDGGEVASGRERLSAQGRS